MMAEGLSDYHAYLNKPAPSKKCPDFCDMTTAHVRCIWRISYARDAWNGHV